MKLNLKRTAYAVSVALAAFSGSVATYGLTKFCPGAFAIVIAMGILFEAGKLTSFAMLHKGKLPRTLKAALLVIGSFLMMLNIVGVSGQLSSSYVHRQIEANVATHDAKAQAAGELAELERQIAAIDVTIAQANEAKIKARDDRDRKRAAEANRKEAQAQRDALAPQAQAARQAAIKAEGQQMSAAGEFAAVAFIAQVTGSNMDRVANLIILVISAIPDLLAVLLLVAAGYKPVVPVRKIKRRRTVKPRKAPATAALRVIK